MKKFLSLFAIASVLSQGSAAQALSRIQIPTEQALGTVSEVSVPAGHSVVLSFDNDHYIQSIWIDDPALLGVTTNRPLCGTQGNGGGCGFATSVRLTQLAGDLDLPGASFRKSGGRATLVSISTTDAAGSADQIYQFVMNTTHAETAQASLVSIVPDVQVSEPSARPSASPSPSGRPTIASLQRAVRRDYDLTKIRRGRDVAVAQGRADVDSDAWRSLESFLALTEGGNSLPSAMSHSQVSSALLVELERLGSLAQI